MKTIYFVQQRKFYGYDSYDNENIEECMIIGYFTSLKLVEDVKKICIKNGIRKKTFDVQTFDVTIRNNQKYVYILSHTYSIINPDGTYTDFEYIFEPQSNKKNCIKLKEKLKIDLKYKQNKNRIYDVCPPDGFCIAKWKLDCIYFPIYMELS